MLRGRAGLLIALLSVACGGSSSNAQVGTSSKKHAPPPPDTTAVTAFSVSNESLNIDKISMREGGTVPDGNRDLVFTASVEGPVDALFLVNCSSKGDPLQGFRADTVAGHEELPGELGGIVDVGRLTVWIAVVEDGKFINTEGGAIATLRRGSHALKLYVPNTGTLHPGSFLRLYARAPGGGLVAGPVVTY